MKIFNLMIASSAALALAPASAAANGADMSFAVHDIIVSSNIPALNISVRNMASSTNPAQRSLQVTSPRPTLNVAGQVWCKSFQNAHTRAASAQVMFGNTSLMSSPDGVDVMPIGPWSKSPVAQLGANEPLRNYNINAPVDFHDRWNGGIDFGFNPVREVEERLEHYVQNGAGSEADFLRVDDVFQTTITLNAVGWCEYAGQNIQGRYAGYRSIEVPVHIFYHGDPDIQDPVTAVGSANTVNAPAAGPGPFYRPVQPQGRATPPPTARRPRGT